MDEVSCLSCVRDLDEVHRSRVHGGLTEVFPAPQNFFGRNFSHRNLIVSRKALGSLLLHGSVLVL